MAHHDWLQDMRANDVGIVDVKPGLVHLDVPYLNKREWDFTFRHLTHSKVCLRHQPSLFFLSGWHSDQGSDRPLVTVLTLWRRLTSLALQMRIWLTVQRWGVMWKEDGWCSPLCPGCCSPIFRWKRKRRSINDCPLYFFIRLSFCYWIHKSALAQCNMYGAAPPADAR